MAKSAVELAKLREALPDDVGEEMTIRLHRAIRWLGRAETETADIDVKFILLWISFNALYARDLSALSNSFKGESHSFFRKIVGLDTENQIQNLIWNSFSNSMRTLLDNKFAYHGYWESIRAGKSNSKWEKGFNYQNKKALVGLSDGMPVVVLEVIFGRLYTLRNQLVHGGATHNSSVNRDQIKDGARILESLVPVMIEIILQNPYEDFGAISYPVINNPYRK